MAAYPLPVTRFRAFSRAGLPLIGGKVYAYESGSTTEAKATYSDKTKENLNTWPVILDDAGSAAIYISGDYFIRVFDADDVLVEEGDGVADPESVAQALIDASSGGAGDLASRVTDLETRADEATDRLNGLDDTTTEQAADIAELDTRLTAEVTTDRNAAIADANTTLQTAVNAQITTLTNQVNAVSGVVVGSVQAYAGATPPTGYLECAGQAISRTDYAGLFAAIGTYYGIGNGSSTFNIPDLRGEFVRGWDHGRNVDNGRALGTTQDDRQQNITGQFVTLTNALSTGVLSNLTSGTANVSGNPSAFNHATVNLDASTQIRTGTEVRPRNVAMMYIIKA